MEMGTKVLHSLHSFRLSKKFLICTLNMNSISCPQWILHTCKLSTKLATLNKSVWVLSLIEN